MPRATACRAWTLARAWLLQALAGGEPARPPPLSVVGETAGPPKALGEVEARAGGATMPAEFQQVKAIFLAAVEKADPDERAAYLQQACGGDAALRRQVEALLRRHEQAGSFLEPPAPDPQATGDVQPSGSNAAA